MIKFKNKNLFESKMLLEDEIDKKEISDSANIDQKKKKIVKKIVSILTQLRTKYETYSSQLKRFDTLAKRLYGQVGVLKNEPEAFNNAREQFGIRNVSTEGKEFIEALEFIAKTIKSIPTDLHTILTLAGADCLQMSKEATTEDKIVAKNALSIEDFNDLFNRLNNFNTDTPNELFKSGTKFTLDVARDIKIKLNNFKNTYAVTEPLVKALVTKVKDRLNIEKEENKDRQNIEAAKEKGAAAFKEIQNKNSVDWQKLYNNTKAENMSNFWANYFEVTFKEFSKDPDLEIALGSGFKDDIVKKGFTEYENPIIGFLKTFLIPKVFSELTDVKAKRDAYVLISGMWTHNNLLKDNDLRGTGELGKINIIFCKDLYKKTFTEQARYLELQHTIKNDFKKDNFTEDFKTVLIKKYGEKGKKEYLFDIMFTHEDESKEGPFANSDEVIITEAQEKYVENVPLRPYQTAEQLVEISIKTKNKGQEIKKVELTADNVEDIATSKSEAEKISASLINRFSTRGSVKKINDIYVKYPSLRDIKMSELNDESILAKVEKLTVKSSNLEAVIDAIAKKWF